MSTTESQLIIVGSERPNQAGWRQRRLSASAHIEHRWPGVPEPVWEWNDKATPIKR
jgi:hypothetical protein